MSILQVVQMSRRYGFGAGLHWLGYRLAQHVMRCDVTHLMRINCDRVRMPEHKETKFSFRFLTADEILEFSRDPSNDLDPSLCNRVRSGRDYCFAALCGTRLAAYAWYALGSIEAEHNRGTDPACGVAVSYPSDMAFMYKGFTHPEFRGQKLYAMTMGLAVFHLNRLGVSTVITTTDWTNWPALDSCRQLGYQYLGRIWRFGWARFLVTHRPKAARKLGILLGCEADIDPRPGRVGCRVSGVAWSG